jgi:hypothetical protein
VLSPTRTALRSAPPASNPWSDFQPWVQGGLNVDADRNLFDKPPAACRINDLNVGAKR